MTPKFKGDEEDWLDSDESSGNRGGKPPKKGKGQVDYLPSESANATVCEVFPNQCAVYSDEGKRFACSYRKAKLPNVGEVERAPVAVGDRVHFEALTPDSGVIDGICKRRNLLARPAPARSTKHVLVANVDTVVIVAASREPEFTPGLVDRFLVAAQAQEIEPILCITKMDLHPSEEIKSWELYRSLGFPVHEVCAKTGLGLAELERVIAGKLTTFCGHSGVGKTSLLNALLGKTVGKTAEVSQSTGKGQHTTTGAYLIAGTTWIDTPGIREFGLTGIDPDLLRNYFPEFAGLPCQARDCFHRHEENCDAHKLPRYGSYRRILESLIAGEN